MRLAIVEVDEDHPLLWTEQMMPVLPVCRVPHVDDAIDLAVDVEGRQPAHRGHALDQHRQPEPHGAGVRLQHLREERPVAGGPGLDGEGYTSFTIASPTGEGLTGPRSFSRWRRCVLVDHFRIT